MKKFITICLLVPCLFATAQRKDTANIARPGISIELAYPTEERPSTEDRPEFSWKTGRSPKGTTFTLTINELNKENIREEKMIFQQKGITGSTFKYPSALPSLDSTKLYSWTIEAFDSNGVSISRKYTSVIYWPPYFCFFWAFPLNSNRICLGISPPLLLGYNLFGGTGTISWTISNGQSGTGNPITVNTPSAPGVYNYILTVTRGSCIKYFPFTLYVYPNLTVQINKTDICEGEDAVLTLSPAGYPVMWEWADPFSLAWIPFTSSTNPQNTNPINPFVIALPPGTNVITRQFRALVNIPGLPDPWPCGQLTTQLNIWRKTNAGTITVSPGTNICSNNNPVNVTLSLNGYVGTILGWTRTGPGGFVPISGATPITNTITQAGTYTYTARVRNGPATGGCGEQTTSVQVYVEDPITATITGNKIEVCPNDDATLTGSTTGGSPAGNNIKWRYQINCTGTWWPAGTGATQNTNSIGSAGPYNPYPVTSICWQAVVSSSTGTCPPATSNTWKIDIIQPIATPTLSLVAGTSPKCPGASVTLQASPSNGFYYQWYLDGELVSGSANPTITVTAPGNYTVEVFNKNMCESKTSAAIKVIDCENVVVIQGPCVSNGKSPVTLTAVSNPNIAACNGPYTYQWLGPTLIGNTQSISVNPAVTTTYTVKVTNSLGCTTTVLFTVKVCN